MCLMFRVKRTEHVLGIIQEVESQIESFHAIVGCSTQRKFQARIETLEALTVIQTSEKCLGDCSPIG